MTYPTALVITAALIAPDADGATIVGDWEEPSGESQLERQREKIMYARLTQFNLGPGQRKYAEELVEIFMPVVAALKGHKSTTFMADIEAGEFSALSIWETKENAHAAGEEMAPWLKAAVGDRLKGPPSIKVLEVYEPKT